MPRLQVGQQVGGRGLPAALLKISRGGGCRRRQRACKRKTACNAQSTTAALDLLRDRPPLWWACPTTRSPTTNPTCVSGHLPCLWQLDVPAAGPHPQVINQDASALQLEPKLSLQGQGRVMHGEWGGGRAGHGTKLIANRQLANTAWLLPVCV